MLEKITFKNVGPIESATLDLKKMKYTTRPEMVADKYLYSVFLYGRNGSGKSSLINGVHQAYALLFGEASHLVPFLPSMLHVSEPSQMSFVFSVADVRYTYMLSTQFEKATDSINFIIHEERLATDEGVIFRRGKDRLEYRGESTDLNPSLFPTLRELAMVKAVDDTDIKNAYAFFEGFAISTSEGQFCLANRQRGLLDIAVEKTVEINRSMKDLGEFPEVKLHKSPEPQSEKPSYFGMLKVNDDFIRLPLSMVSEGTVKMQTLLAMVSTLKPGSVLFADEIENRLHPLVLPRFMNLLIEKRIQLVAASHNTSILKRLRPDQVYFAAWKNGISQFKRLGVIYPNIREINNIEKMYLSLVFDEGINE
ncbi:MAG: AAA family ATPase [Bacilli bacterium]|nr:AAA family ATPase [Bacilli bacterium]